MHPPPAAAIVIRGDAAHLPLPDASVDLLVTSPPYFALRSYTDGGEHYAGQIGSEATPAKYIAALVECTREWMRVLKPSGSIFVNLGDKYAGQGTLNSRNSVGGHLGKQGKDGGLAKISRRAEGVDFGGIRGKSLMLLPERYRIACVDQLCLIARAVLIWSKPNGLPESVTDRARRSHEDWVHLTKMPRYFAAVDEIREAHADHTLRYYGPGVRTEPRGGKNGQRRDDAVWHSDPGGTGLNSTNPLGKLPGSVWTIPTEPLQVPERLAVEHYAAFPSEWPRRLILGWSPNGVCTACGEGRRPVVVKGASLVVEQTNPNRLSTGQAGNGSVGFRYAPSGPVWNAWKAANPDTVTGYACACPDATAPTRPAVVLDPFGGTGTTAHVATALGRTGITVDLSADYCRLAAAPELADRRLRKVLGLDKPVPVPGGQLSLADLTA